MFMGEGCGLAAKLFVRFLQAEGKVLVAREVARDTRVGLACFGPASSCAPQERKRGERVKLAKRESLCDPYVRHEHQAKVESCSGSVFRDQSCRDHDEEGAWQWRFESTWLEETPTCETIALQTDT